MNKCSERVNDWHFWNPEVFSYAMIPRSRANSRVIFFFIVASIVYGFNHHLIQSPKYPAHARSISHRQHSRPLSDYSPWKHAYERADLVHLGIPQVAQRLRPKVRELVPQEEVNEVNVADDVDKVEDLAGDELQRPAVVQVERLEEVLGQGLLLLLPAFLVHEVGDAVQALDQGLHLACDCQYQSKDEN